VLDSVGEIDLASRDPCSLQRLVENSPGRPDEGHALDVLAIARLLADQHESGALVAFAKHGLRGVFPQVTGFASGRCLTERLDAELLWDRR
jgi:hypothetical protein